MVDLSLATTCIMEEQTLVRQQAPLLQLATTVMFQLMNMTGEVYFTNRADGTRNTKDPRLTGYYLDDAYYYADSSIGSDDIPSDEDDDDYGIGNTNRFYSSPVEVAPADEDDPTVLVAAGCTFCLMFVMVPKLEPACPKCGRDLLHLGRNGYF